MQNDNKDFKDYIKNLPLELRRAIFSIDYPQKLQEIVKNNKLMIDQAGKLEAETTLVIVGIEPMDKYVNNLISHAGLSNIQASIVAHDVNESIFKNIRDSLKKINDQIKEEDGALNKTEETAAPTKESLISGIENPTNIKDTEEPISISSLRSNGTRPEIHEEIDRGVEIRINNLPEIAPKIPLPITLNPISKQNQPYHLNISPVSNIVESKLTETVIVPKETVVIEEKTKLPEKLKPTIDPYKEPII